MKRRKPNPRRGAAFKPKRQPHPCRCYNRLASGNTCNLRVTLSKHPLQYVRTPRCTRCKAPITRVDWYRMKVEWEAVPCNCGGYAYPHARGRGYCEHNPNLTAEDLRRREEGDGPTEIAYATDDPPF